MVLMVNIQSNVRNLFVEAEEKSEEIFFLAKKCYQQVDEIFFSLRALTKASKRVKTIIASWNLLARRVIVTLFRFSSVD